MKLFLKLILCLQILTFSHTLFAQDLPEFDFFQLLNKSGHVNTFSFVDEEIDLSEAVHYEISYTKWEPWWGNGQVIIYNHGLQSHRGWFNGSAEFLSFLGYTVYSFDRIGSGTSSDGVTITELYDSQEGYESIIIKKPGHIRSWKLFTQTLDAMVQVVRIQHPEQKINLLANSFGSHVVTAYINQYRADDIENIIFATPAFYPSLPLPFDINDLIFSSPGTYFDSIIPEVNHDNGAGMFTSQYFYHYAIKNDKKSLRRLTKEYYLAISQISQFNLQTHNNPEQYLNNFRRFYLMVDGDPMMDNVKTAQYIQNNNINSYAKFYDGGEDHKHFLTFTSDMYEVLLDMNAFIQNKEIIGLEQW